jgi:hypothetical protein
VSARVHCQIAECRRDVVPALSVQGLCVEHYLDVVSARLQTALELCQSGAPVERGRFDWLLSQGEFAARALSKGAGVSDPLERTRLLEFLLCLANLHEYAERHSSGPAPPARARARVAANAQQPGDLRAI